MKVLLFLVIGFTFSAWSLVDTKSGNYKKTFVDFDLKGAVFPLTMERTYNSRSLYRGLFGMGWCSNIETRVRVLPDNSIQLTECGGGQEILFLTQNAKQDVSVQIEQIIQAVKKQNKKLSSSYYAQLKQKLAKSHILKNEFLKAYKVSGQVSTGVVHFAEGRSNDSLVFNKKGWFKRTLSNGVQQFFAKNSGRLIQISDKAGNYIKIVWKKEQPEYIVDNKGRRLVFSYKQGQVASIKGLGKTLASYQIKDENLVRVVNKDGEHKHAYDDLHNLTQTIYPGGTKKDPAMEKLTYNKKKDWVTSFENQRRCVETYKYKTNTKNPNHYWTDVEKKCGKVVTNVSRYEFWNKKGSDEVMYLHRARQKVNGDVRDVTYHPRFRRVSNLTQNGVRTQYKYYSAGSFKGLLKEKVNRNQKTSFAKYDTKCLKPMSVGTQRLANKKVVNQETVQIQYNSSTCLMRKVSRSDGRWVSLSHDEKGRIDQMKDQSGKIVLVSYDDRVNKPQKITQKGVGSIEIEYDSKGMSKGWKNSNDPVIMSQVMSMFNGLMEIITPVAQEMNI